MADAVVAMLDPIRERYTELRADESRLRSTLRTGAEQAQAVAAPTLTTIKRRMGFDVPEA